MSETLENEHKCNLLKRFSKVREDYIHLAENARNFPKGYNVEKLSPMEAFDLVGEIGGVFSSLEDSLRELDRISSHSERYFSGGLSYESLDVSSLLRFDNRLKQHIKKSIDSNPELLKSLVCDCELPNDYFLGLQKIDWLFGLEKKDSADDLQDGRRLFARGSQEQLGGGPTAYQTIRKFISLTNPSEKDVVYDLGSGDGRVLFYGALSTRAQYKGIEILPSRVKRCLRVKNRLGISNVDFTEGNVNEIDFSDGNIFFMFNPFNWKTLERTGERLKELAETKQVTITIAIGYNGSFFDDWVRDGGLERTDYQRSGLTIYRSVRKNKSFLGGKNE